MFRVNNPNPRKQICRKRSVVWRFYKAVDSRSVQCLLCKGFQSRQCHGSTTAMLRHLRVKHPKEVAKKCKGLIPETSKDHLDMETDGEQFCSVEVALEEGDSNNPTIVSESDLHSSINGITETAPGVPAEQMTHEEASDDRPVTHTGHKRSLIWKYFDHLDRLGAARCHTCMKKLQFSESSSTSNLRRHLSNRHPELFAKLVAETRRSRQSNSALSSNPKSDTSTAPENVAATQHKMFSVEVALDDGDSDTPTAVNESDNRSSINGITETSQGVAAEQMTQEEASDGHPVTHTGHKRSLIWKYFDHLKSLDAARCHICMKKLHCSDSSGTGNLCRHMSKRHPELFAKLSAETRNTQAPNSAPRPNANGDTRTAPQHKLFSEVLKDSRVCDGEKRVLRRERELIEALRRTQKEEARALEHQRELLEKLRAADAKETAAEREKIESLRKAQQEEAKDLSRQREELQKEKEELEKEKEELQKKWEALQQEREELILFPQGQ